MPNPVSAIELPTQVQNLLEQRQQHVDAITQIDATFARVTAAIDGAASPKPVAAAAPAARKPAVTKARGGSRYAVSASDLVLTYLKNKKGATTKEITQYLASQGRAAGAVSNALS